MEKARSIDQLSVTSKVPEVRAAQRDGIAMLRGLESGRPASAEQFDDFDTEMVFGASDVLDFNRIEQYFLCHLTDLTAGELRRRWDVHSEHPLEMAAILHRLSWAYLNSRDAHADEDRDDHAGSESTHEVADMTRAAHGIGEFPHALLSLRCSALVHSKRHHYTESWLGFAELRQRLSHFERDHGVDQGAASEAEQTPMRMYHEVREQAFLAETGTAARVIEHRLQNWFRLPRLYTSPGWERRERHAYRESYTVLQRGAATGALAHAQARGLDLGSMAKGRHKEQISLPSWLRRPAVMTARCHLALAPLCHIMRELKRTHPEHGTWTAQLAHHAAEFIRHYIAAIDDPDDGTIDRAVIREVLQLRLFAALIYPMLPLPALPKQIGQIEVPPSLCEALPSRDQIAADLRQLENADGTLMKADANITLSISAPRYLGWVQAMSANDDTIDWMLDGSQDSLRRPSVRDLFDVHREEIRSAAKATIKSVPSGAESLLLGDP